MKILITLLVLIPSLSWGEHKFGEYEKEEKEFIEDVRNNDFMQHGVWLEFRGVADPTTWNKVIFIFGYGEAGNYDTCMDIVKNTYSIYYSSNDVRCQEVI